jgi:hypothetical protein
LFCFVFCTDWWANLREPWASTTSLPTLIFLIFISLKFWDYNTITSFLPFLSLFLNIPYTLSWFLLNSWLLLFFFHQVLLHVYFWIHKHGLFNQSNVTCIYVWVDHSVLENQLVCFSLLKSIPILSIFQCLGCLAFLFS